MALTQQQLYAIVGGNVNADLYMHLLTSVPLPVDGDDPLAEPTFLGYAPSPLNVSGKSAYQDVGVAICVGSGVFANMSGGPFAGIAGWAISIRNADGTHTTIFVTDIPQPIQLPAGPQKFNVQFSVQLYNGPQ